MRLSRFAKVGGLEFNDAGVLTFLDLAIYNTVWPTLLDGCSLTRDTEAVLKNAGAWESATIGADPREGYFESLPHTTGRLIK
jgi:hypothetical protein